MTNASQHVSVIAVVLVGTSLLAGESFEDTAFGFRMTVPDGFVRNKAMATSNPKIIHVFERESASNKQIQWMLFIEKMRGTIGREPIRKADMPAGFKGRLFKTQWQGFNVDAFEVPEQVGSIQTITFNVQIPLKRRAIQVKLFGPAADKPALRRLLREVLRDLKGDSNWIPSVIDNTGGNEQSYRNMLLGVAVAVIVFGVIRFWILSKFAPKGSVLVVAGCIFVVTMALRGVRQREMLLLVGSFRLLSVVGIILGLVDVFRRRNEIVVTSADIVEAEDVTRNPWQ